MRTLYRTHLLPLWAGRGARGLRAGGTRHPQRHTRAAAAAAVRGKDPTLSPEGKTQTQKLSQPPSPPPPTHTHTHKNTACGKWGYNDEGVGSWSGGCTGAKITAVDGTSARDQFNIISKVRLHYSADNGCVKGVVARHGWDNPANLVTVGSTAFPEVAKLALTSGERITSVSWAAKGGCITYLALKTNKGNEAAAGEASADAATFTAKDGQYLAAFKGATSEAENCAPLSALSFRWGYDDCAAPAPTCDAMFTCNGYGGLPCGAASCVDGQVVVGFGKISKPTGLKCAEAACGAAPAPSVKTFSGVIGKKTFKLSAGNRRLQNFGLEKLQALKGMATGAATQATAAATQAVNAKVAAANQAVSAKVAAANQAVAAASNAVNAKVAAVAAAKAQMAAAKDKCFTVCKKEGLDLSALKASLKGL